MPTTYTASIHDGKDYSFEKYMIGCAKQFGANISMRDLPLDEPIPVYEPDVTYHKTRVAESQLALEKLGAATEEELIQQIDEQYERDMASYHERVKNNQEREARYHEILALVSKWEPPSDDHIEYKNFCMQQLQDSIAFDCGYVPEQPQRWKLDDYKAFHIHHHKDNIDYHQKRIDEEIERTNKRNKWNALLMESLQQLSDLKGETV